jgi:hypothetical protein
VASVRRYREVKFTRPLLEKISVQPSDSAFSRVVAASTTQLGTLLLSPGGFDKSEPMRTLLVWLGYPLSALRR